MTHTAHGTNPAISSTPDRGAAQAFRLVPGSAHDAMLMVGVIEIVAGVAVAVRPRFGGLLVAAWLGGIILNLVTTGEYYDVALRDFGLLAAALSLSLLAPRRTPSDGTAR